MEVKRQSLALKFIVVGDPLVGKTSHIMAFTRKFFASEDPPLSTIAPEKYCTELQLNEVKYVVTIWDTPSLDGYENIRGKVFKDAHCIIICFSVDQPSSLANIEEQWLPEVFDTCPEATIILMGTKLDLRKCEKEIKLLDEAQEMVTRYELDGICSCMATDIQSVETAFRTALQTVLSKNKL